MHQNLSTHTEVAFINEGTSNIYTTTRPVTGTEIIEQAKNILNQQGVEKESFADCHTAKDFFIMHLSGLPYEVFGVAFLNSRNMLIAFEPMFRGSVSETHVYPREVAKKALELNAVNLILAHNHPSGDSTNPSTADKAITTRLVEILQLFDIKVLDHFIVSGNQVFSFAETGLL